MRTLVPTVLALFLAPLAAQGPIDPGAAAALRWFDGLGHGQDAAGPFVKVWTGRWYRSGKEPPQNTWLHGFLVADDGADFEVLDVDLRREHFTRTGKGTPEHQRVGYEVLPLRAHARKLLEAARGTEAPDRYRAFATPRRMHSAGTELFVTAWACWKQGDAELARDLIDEAGRVLGKRWADVEGDVLPLVAADLGHVEMWRLVLAFGDPKVSWQELHRRSGVLVERYPRSQYADRARKTRAVLERMLAAERPARAGAAQLAFDLREQNGSQWLQPGSCDIFNDPRGDASPAHRLRAMGFEAVPALIEACGDDSFSRSIGYHRGFYFSHTVLRVRDCARRVLEEISGENFHHHEPGGAQVLARRWWRKVQELGEEKVLVAGCRRGDDHAPKKAVQLLAKYPGAAFDAITAGARAAHKVHVRQALVTLAARIEGEEAAAFLREEMANGSRVGPRVAAAVALMRRGEGERAAKAMIDCWRGLWAGSGPSSHDAEAVGTFLACCGRVDAIAALAAEPDHLSDDIIDALAGGPQWFMTTCTPDGGTVRFVLAEPTPDVAAAVEALLRECLGRDRVIAGNFGGTVDPRVCDFAARALGRRWPDRYAFDFAASFEDRTARIAVLRKSLPGRR